MRKLLILILVMQVQKVTGHMAILLFVHSRYFDCLIRILLLSLCGTSNLLSSTDDSFWLCEIQLKVHLSLDTYYQILAFQEAFDASFVLLYVDTPLSLRLLCNIEICFCVYVPPKIASSLRPRTVIIFLIHSS